MKRCMTMFCIIAATYITLLLYSNNVFQTLGQGFLLLVYWMLVFGGISRLVRKFLCDSFDKKHSIYLMAFLLSLISLLFCNTSLFLRFKEKSTVEIIATGEKNEQAFASEVWITGMVVDGVSVDLKDIPPSEGWSYREEAGALLRYSSNNDTTQIIELGKFGQARISFVKHAWSGKIKIKLANQYYEVDLYDPDDLSYVCELSGNIYQTRWLDFISGFIAYIILFILYLLICGLYIKNHKYIPALSILYTMFIFLNFDDIAKIPLPILLCIITGHVLMSIGGFSWYCNLKNRLSKFILFIATFLVGFLIFGSRMFILSQNYSLLRFGKFIGLVIWLIPCVAFICRCFEVFERILHTDKIQDLSASTGSMPYKNRIAAAIFSILITSLLIGSICQIFFFENNSTCKIVITPTGEKNKASNGTEVLLSGISVDGASYSPECLEILPDGWKNIGGTLFGVETTPLEIDIPYKGTVIITFSKHAWSGKVRIEDGDNVAVLDLYSAGNSPSYVETYTITGNRNYMNSWYDIPVLIGISLLSLSFVFKILCLVQRIWIGEVKKRQFFWGVFLSENLIYAFYILASYPAALSVDSITQLNQVIGTAALSDAHPLLHTLLIKYLTLGGRFLAGIPIVQSFFMSFLSSVILTYLFEKKLNRKLLLIFGGCSALTITNGVYISIIWKDIPYSICLLWLSYLLFRMESDKEYVGKLGDFALVTVALVAVSLLRHNGIVVLIFSCILLVGWGFVRRKYNYWIIALCSVLCALTIRGPIYNTLLEEDIEVKNIASGGLSSLFHGIVYAGIQDDIPDKSRGFLENIMPIEEWRMCYSKYSANELFLGNRAEGYQVAEKVGKVGTGGLIKEYLRILAYSPMRLVEDRLFGIDVLWNVIQDNAYDWRTANDTYEIGIVVNGMGWYRHDNLFTDIVKKIYRFTTENKILDAIFWRAGIWMGFMVLLICYECITRKTTKVVFFPVFSNIMSLCLAMAWQDFRYVYFMNLCIPYLVLLCLSENRNDKIEEKYEYRY